MVLICFVLDLCGLSPPLLRDLKQCLLQLANFHAISSPPRNHPSKSLPDRIGLCYCSKDRTSGSHELKVAYNPIGNFNLRDFHHAVNNLPEDAFSPEIDDSIGLRSGVGEKLSSVFTDHALYSWGGNDVMRKVIVLCSFVPDNLDSALKMTLMEAAEKCVSLEFVLFEQSSNHLINFQDNVNCFMRSLSDLDNCSFRTYLPDGRVFQGLIKRWLHELKDDMEDPLQARFVFNSNMLGSLNFISCNLSVPFNQIIDGFGTCQACRCHGFLIDNTVKEEVKGPSCSVTGQYLETCQMECSLKVGEKTILFMPSFQSSLMLQQVSLPIEFYVIERTNLKTLSEGLVIGSSYFVTPSSNHDIESSSDEMDHSDLNAQFFQGVCSALHSMDEGLICFSYCNLETMRGATFRCYYILQPSDNGPMLLRRVAGSEEVLPVPDVSPFIDSSLTKESQNSIQANLLKMESSDYDPLLHERGFHQKLNQLVRDSSQFGSSPTTSHEAMSVPNSTQTDLLEQLVHSNSPTNVIIVEDETVQLDQTAVESKTADSIPEEWEQLVVSGVRRTISPSCISKPKLDHFVLSPSADNKQLDPKTSKILERLEVPRPLKPRVVSPLNSRIAETSVSTKMPLVPFQPIHLTNECSTSSQLMKPNFQRLKRKHR
ncbi:hypothetical protein K2173_027676 [Erythroxylum novogranatense]|uniref:Uncharacterized protein n=1 Tax=Erythroxylum novogranatense TaxID=1862640 RepID=A0AAV8U2Z0_9ROSI|nr:hypothetical protein K2173_027676 [Erythroxylum novogranatense]